MTELSEPPQSLMRRRDGSVRCCVCFEWRRKGELYVDPEGETWDVCGVGECADAVAHVLQRIESALRDGPHGTVSRSSS